MPNCDKYGTLGRMIYENAVAKLLKGEITVEQAMTYIMEFARESHWPLVVDENLRALAVELARLKYKVRSVEGGLPDEEIIRRYSKRGVFITENTEDFDLTMVPDPFDDGLILVPAGVDARRLARIIERLLMRWEEGHPAEPVKIGRGEIARLLKGGPAVRRRRSRRP